MKNSITILNDKNYREIINKEKSIELSMSKNCFEYDNVDEMLKKLEEVQNDFFISQLKIINILNREEYNKICVVDFGSRSGLTHKVVTEIGNYRFTEVCNNVDNILIRRYFIMNFNKTIIIEGQEYCEDIYELDIKSFCILICEICSTKQDIENNIDEDDAKKHLNYMEKIIDKFIKGYFEKINLIEKLGEV
ncbi:hypothetical protein FDC45_00955 [Clostridium botulinum]|uniref:Uncharacterized protein n=1 Tax=Clostridium botulinum TaxID=1491 RepID=A0A846J1Z5_CLOBO|nr:hypothetical protein [Clostridium botulinum]ACA53723.1 putative rhoptry protein [Clostridium botulinum A3 str. Loch Maree]NFH64199.1 hypothetical protein [Clostridium botulinum]NFJ07222.1 hypothetical protein [Clostridium botulinum]NFK14194.1 hypothetical protein [Clostridium botulinum]NFM92150.1 hypothetical protein [Clostridium botulinum]